ncbi:zinc finger protein ZPR1 [Prorops nasuta]|uniref:zinc finger protein ZPR1 n=1 Tax=Prorops nasuta TaxID=863751 RepID=UPI0034CFE06C
MEEVNSAENRSTPIFRDLTADDPTSEATVIESLCMNCGENGVTKLLLTKIPYFKDVIVMSFHCEHCNYQNNEIQSGGKIADKGIKIVLQVTTQNDLNRQVVKSDHTKVTIPHLDFEIPGESQKGEITTVEGIINRSVNGLKMDQPRREKEEPEVKILIERFIQKLKSLINLHESFTIIFEDISGNCNVENPNAPLKDNNCKVKYFKRSKEQDQLLGIYQENQDGLLKPIAEEDYSLEKIDGEVLSFTTNCPECNAVCETNMKMTDIPHFKKVVIMATCCEACGHRTNEVKSGSGIEPLGIKIEIKVAGKEDFSRDLLKSDTCRMEIPSLELQVGPTTLGGRFTTVEGIIMATRDQLSSSTAFTGDSNDPETKKRMEDLINNLTDILEGKQAVTLVLDDPAGNSYIQSLSDDGTDDRLKITKYKRTFEDNEELGINDMKVDNY